MDHLATELCIPARDDQRKLLGQRDDACDVNTCSRNGKIDNRTITNWRSVERLKTPD